MQNREFFSLFLPDFEVLFPGFHGFFQGFLSPLDPGTALFLSVLPLLFLSRFFCICMRLNNRHFDEHGSAADSLLYPFSAIIRYEKELISWHIYPMNN